MGGAYACLKSRALIGLLSCIVLTVNVAIDAVEAIEQAQKLLAILKEDKEAWRTYELRQKWLMDSASERMTAREEGLEEGRAEGKIEGKIEIVKKLLTQGFSLEEISNIVEIPIDELKVYIK